MLLFRELARRHSCELKPIAAELVFDQGRIVVLVLVRRAARHAGAPDRPRGGA